MDDFGLDMDPDVRTIKLKRKTSDSFGFALRGGREHQVGFFVTQVKPGSESHKQGLKVGDQVMRINGLPVEEAMHNEMLNLIRTKTRLTLTVKSGAVIPYYECANRELAWQPISAINHAPLDTPILSKHAYNDVIRVVVNLEGKGRLGSTICQGPSHKPGIFIQSTREGSTLRAAGLRAGDQILNCNGKDFRNIEFSRAIQILKESLTLNLLVAKTAGSDFIAPGESSGYNSAASSVNGDQSPTQNDKKRLSVVREEMIDVYDERRGFVVGSVTVDSRRPWSDIETEWNSAELKPISRKQILRENSLDSQKTKPEEDLVEQEKKLQEEKQRIEQAQRELKIEAERIARERRLLEEERMRLLSRSFGNLCATPSSGENENLVNEKQQDIYTEINPLTKKVAAEPKRHQQHEQLMEEFKEMHRKRFTESSTESGDSETTDGRSSSAVKLKVSGSSQSSDSGTCNPHAALQNRVSAPPPPPPPPPLPPALPHITAANKFATVTGSSSKSSVRPSPSLPVPLPDYEANPVLVTAKTNPNPITQPMDPIKTVTPQPKEPNPGPEVVLRKKNPIAEGAGTGIRISIGSYPSAQQRPNPSKLDFLPVQRKPEVKTGSQKLNGNQVKSLLQDELNETLSRARLRQRQPEENGSTVQPPPPLPVQAVQTIQAVQTVQNTEPEAQEPKPTLESKMATKSGSLAVRKPEAVVFSSTKANTVRLGKNVSTVVISSESSSASSSSAAIRKPAPSIQARMAALQLGAKNADLNELPRVSAADEEVVSKVVSDNKVVIHINAKTKEKSGILKSSPAALQQSAPAANAATGKNISFGKTTYIDSLPVTEL